MNNDYCAGCPRRAKPGLPGNPGAVGAWGEDDAPVLVVGMSPGKDELALGAPFVGASGALVWGVGQKVGLVRPDCKIVNTACCWPCGPKGKTLSKEQVAACRPHLVSVLQASQARVVVCLGADAFEAVTGLITWEREQQKELAKKIKRQGGYYRAKPVGIEQWRGYLVKPNDCPPLYRTVQQEVPDYNKTYKSDKKNLDGTYKYRKGDPRMKKVKVRVADPRPLPERVEWIVGLYHPSFVMRMGRKPMPAFVNDLGRAMRALRGELDIVDVKYETSVPA